jgi:hypothetical protein
MFSMIRQKALVLLLVGAGMTGMGVSISAVAAEKKEKPLSPEMILEKDFEGKATVEFLVQEVTTLNIDSVFIPDVSHAQILRPKVEGEKNVQEFCVVVSREVATRLLQLGIEDPAEHFRGKQIRASGKVEKIKGSAPGSPTLYKIHVTNLNQLESIRKP